MAKTVAELDVLIDKLLDVADTANLAGNAAEAEAAARTAAAAIEIRKVRAYERDRTDR